MGVELILFGSQAIMLIALMIRLISVFSETVVDRYGAVDIPPTSIKSAPSLSICFTEFLMSFLLRLMDFL